MKIVFDFAGVLFRWQPLALLQRALPHLAGSPEHARHWAAQIFQGYEGDWGDFDRGTVTIPELVHRIARRTGLAHTDVQRVVDAAPEELQPLPEAVALLRRLHEAGAELYFLSNMPAPYASLLEARNTFFGCFSDGIFSGRVHLAKPDAAIFRLASDRFGAAPETLVFMDDHLPNVRVAQALGWNAFQYTSAAQSEAELGARGWA
jgi:putative hydrolase of the HAD superfamily